MADAKPDLLGMTIDERVAYRDEVGDAAFVNRVREQTREEVMAGGRAQWLAKRNPAPIPTEAPRPLAFKPRETPLTQQEIARMTPAQRLDLKKRAAIGLSQMIRDSLKDRG